MTRFKIIKKAISGHYRKLRGTDKVRQFAHACDKCLKMDKRKAEKNGKKLFFIRNYQWLSKKNQKKYRHMHEMRKELGCAPFKILINGAAQ